MTSSSCFCCFIVASCCRSDSAPAFLASARVQAVRTLPCQTPLTRNSPPPTIAAQKISFLNMWETPFSLEGEWVLPIHPNPDDDATLIVISPGQADYFDWIAKMRFFA